MTKGFVNMASYRKRNGTWEYRIRYTDPATGKQKEKSVAGFKRKADCIEAAAEPEVLHCMERYIKMRRPEHAAGLENDWNTFFKEKVPS
ncbi:hypothetical protein HB818_01280 [Listeria booriae]|uniref:hypothetical protein n=1 Tax=Listeria booriae TaxID=1552123 RepID=UPI001627ED2D|nr:hypothetical protein [Listeria booriae]MBC1284387.1 hypothetical protein [Listeria booriae]